MISGISGNSQYMFSSQMTNMTDRVGQQPSKIDTDGDGTISKDEFTSHMNDVAEKMGITIDVETTFNSVDTDGNGSLSTTEMEALHTQAPPPPMTDMTGESDENPSTVLFNQLDSDGDGLISESEFQTFTDKISEVTGTTIDAEELFAATDADGDGSLSTSEMESLRPQGPPPPPPPTANASETESETDSTSEVTDEEVSSLMSSLDIDGNGTIDASELKTAMLQAKQSLFNALYDQSDDVNSSLFNLLG